MSDQQKSDNQPIYRFNDGAGAVFPADNYTDAEGNPCPHYKVILTGQDGTKSTASIQCRQTYSKKYAPIDLTPEQAVAIIYGENVLVEAVANDGSRTMNMAAYALPLDTSGKYKTPKQFVGFANLIIQRAKEEGKPDKIIGFKFWVPAKDEKEGHTIACFSSFRDETHGFVNLTATDAYNLVTNRKLQTVARSGAPCELTVADIKPDEGYPNSYSAVVALNFGPAQKEYEPASVNAGGKKQGGVSR